jgi:hypothetical protein
MPDAFLHRFWREEIIGSPHEGYRAIQALRRVIENTQAKEFNRG